MRKYFADRGVVRYCYGNTGTVFPCSYDDGPWNIRHKNAVHEFRKRSNISKTV